MHLQRGGRTHVAAAVVVAAVEADTQVGTVVGIHRIEGCSTEGNIAAANTVADTAVGTAASPGRSQAGIEWASVYSGTVGVDLVRTEE